MNVNAHDQVCRDRAKKIFEIACKVYSQIHTELDAMKAKPITVSVRAVIQALNLLHDLD